MFLSRYGGTGESFYAVILPVIWTKQCTSHVVKYNTGASWEVVREARMRGEPLAELAVSPDDTLLATASSNGHVFVYDTFSMGVSFDSRVVIYLGD